MVLSKHFSYLSTNDQSEKFDRSKILRSVGVNLCLFLIQFMIYKTIIARPRRPRVFVADAKSSGTLQAYQELFLSLENCHLPYTSTVVSGRTHSKEHPLWEQRLPTGKWKNGRSDDSEYSKLARKFKMNSVVELQNMTRDGEFS